ncbi:DUF1704 domain-containing protein [bacterium]|nr:DUF1704 domain-containing protein [bacterium]
MFINDNRWQEIDRQFMEIQANIDLDNYLSPTNRTSELAKFKDAIKAGKSYNPQFTYDPLPDVHETDLLAFRNSLNKEDPVEDIFFEAAECRLGEIRGAKTHSGEVITDVSLMTYGRPKEDLLVLSRKNLTVLKPDQASYTGDREGRTYNAQELAVICRDAMKSYGFDWKVIVKEDFGAKAAVDNLLKEFWIRGDVQFHESLVTMLVVHEIGCHVLRSQNGYAQPLKIFGRGLPAYQFTEEGLAEYSEEQAGALSEDTIFRISGRAIGVDAALKGSFWDVYLAVRDHFDVDMAFDIAQRAKLGIADTSEAGSYTKDYTYLAGLISIRQFFESPTLQDVNALYAGKVGFQHLTTVKQLQSAGYLVLPEALPEWLQLTENE